ncbi:uncharacterized protein AMSG_10293 [Thecamonas trahens ATCC 50062]|uniref:RING-type domain-containing protein n=1 Tax=Thecamonas trahens ATCC 50062 TaxID=461836 RepID=A0A0L0DPS5_THETB|nr:hypothetical protein AMSG_10293 [Thecamonas trahens ATCC 50062]KNC54309.1 hypothetical protein AMSG_10293 [Thecamonas trahens ATCC 50062]|eukprot:XP_013753770.1 hypothetical protein AMSG_10293 [Thecamonas trahens ATCC 50062]
MDEQLAQTDDDDDDNNDGGDDDDDGGGDDDDGGDGDGDEYRMTIDGNEALMRSLAASLAASEAARAAVYETVDKAEVPLAETRHADVMSDEALARALQEEEEEAFRREQVRRSRRRAQEAREAAERALARDALGGGSSSEDSDVVDDWRSETAAMLAWQLRQMGGEMPDDDFGDVDVAGWRRRADPLSRMPNSLGRAGDRLVITPQTFNRIRGLRDDGTPAVVLPPGFGGAGELSYEEMMELEERMGPAVPRGASDAAIDALPTFVVGQSAPPTSSGDTLTCVVCLSELVAGQAAKTLPCLHVFHTQCIDEWLRRVSNCPMCKYDVPK